MQSKSMCVSLCTILIFFQVLYIRAVPEIILRGWATFFFRLLHPQDTHGVRAPQPPGHVSALINPPHYGSNMPWPPGQVTPPPPTPRTHCQQNTLPSTGQKSVCAPPPEHNFWNSPYRYQLRLHTSWTVHVFSWPHTVPNCHGRKWGANFTAHHYHGTRQTILYIDLHILGLWWWLWVDLLQLVGWMHPGLLSCHGQPPVIIGSLVKLEYIVSVELPVELRFLSVAAIYATCRL